MIFTNKHNAKLRSADCLILNVKSNFGNSGEAKTYIAKAVFEDSQYLLLITDLKHVWFEELNSKGLNSRARVLKYLIILMLLLILWNLYNQIQI